MSLKRSRNSSSSGNEMDLQEAELRTSRADRRICPHCNDILSIKTFKKHKQLYYDKVINWLYTVGACIFIIIILTGSVYLASYSYSYHMHVT